MTSDIDELITSLQNGSMTLEQVAQKLRERRWPDKPVTRSASYREMMIRNIQDPEPYEPGSFDDVSAALHQGRITTAEYGVLAKAAAESMRAEDEAAGSGG